MKKMTTALVGILIFFNLLLFPGEALAQSRAFSQLHSLAGTWSMKTKNGVLFENWVRVNDSTLNSRSYQINGNDTIELERAELLLRGGTIVYVPIVGDQNNSQPVVFRLLDEENGIYTFENKGHDFPQRIVYTLPQGRVLHAWIEGQKNGEFRKSDYYYTKVVHR